MVLKPLAGGGSANTHRGRKMAGRVGASRPGRPRLPPTIGDTRAAAGNPSAGSRWHGDGGGFPAPQHGGRAHLRAVPAARISRRFTGYRRPRHRQPAKGCGLPQATPAAGARIRLRNQAPCRAPGPCCHKRCSMLAPGRAGRGPGVSGSPAAAPATGDLPWPCEAAARGASCRTREPLPDLADRFPVLGPGAMRPRHPAVCRPAEPGLPRPLSSLPERCPPDSLHAGSGRAGTPPAARGRKRMLRLTRPAVAPAGAIG